MHEPVIVHLHPTIPIRVELVERLAKLLDDDAASHEAVERDTGLVMSVVLRNAAFEWVLIDILRGLAYVRRSDRKEGRRRRVYHTTPNHDVRQKVDERGQKGARRSSPYFFWTRSSKGGERLKPN